MTFPFGTMSDDEVTAFLCEPRHAIVATLGKAGDPLQSPVWFLFEEGVFYFAVQSTSAKHEHLRRDSRVSICVDAGYPDARQVTCTGHAFLKDSDDSMHYRIARRYSKTEAAAKEYLAKAREGAALVLVGVRPRKIVGRDYN